HRELDRECDGAAGFRTLDSLLAVPVDPPSEMSAGAGARLVDGVTAREIEPELGEVEWAIHVPRQGSVRPLDFAAQLAARAGVVATRVEMTGVEEHDGRVVRVRTSCGDLTPGAVVFATGTSEQ